MIKAFQILQKLPITRLQFATPFCEGCKEVVGKDENVNRPWVVDPRPVSIISGYQKNLTPVSYKPKEGTTIKYQDKTVKYDATSKTTSSEQSFWQKLRYNDENSK